MADNEAKKKMISDSIRGIPDFPKPGILFWDVTTMMLNHAAFKASIDMFTERFGVPTSRASCIVDLSRVTNGPINDTAPQRCTQQAK